MPQPMEIFLPWPVVIVGLILALAITVLLIVLLVKAFSKRYHELEEEAQDLNNPYERRWEPEKFCPRCDAKAKPTARFCDDCGKAL